MFISKLNIHNFRNLVNTNYIFDKKINVFFGSNGVGKTSVLESINYLSTGKSFRKVNFNSLINYDSESFTVYIESSDIEGNNNIYSVSKNRKGKWKGKKNSNNIQKQSEITNSLPVVSIDPEVYRLVDFGPLYRRNFLDWLVFHVKHDYIYLWKKVYKCIKHLNQLYKNKSPSNELLLWEKNFIVFSEELNKTRNDFFNQIIQKIIKLSEYMQPEIKNLSINYKKGWSEEISLEQQIKEDREKSLIYGKVLHGPQKMDIQIKTGKVPASHTLSRGQKKILSITFYMAYIELLLEKNINPIVCLDDFDAELDEEKLLKASDFFKKTEAQLFVTSVKKSKIKKAFPGAEMFHVKHV